MDKIETLLRQNIEELYAEFSKYPYPEAGIISSLDFGPSEEEAIAFGKPLREIPGEYIRRLDFYSNTEQDMAESRYLLPRILECYAEAIWNKDNSSTDSLSGFPFIRYRLTDLNDRGQWTEEEAAAITNFLLLFYEYLITQPLFDSSAPGSYLDAICWVTDDINPYLAIWKKVRDEQKSILIKEWLVKNFDKYTLEFTPLTYDPVNPDVKLRVTKNQNQIKDWVLSDENVLSNVDLFSEDPWYNLVVHKD